MLKVEHQLRHLGSYARSRSLESDEECFERRPPGRRDGGSHLTASGTHPTCTLISAPSHRTTEDRNAALLNATIGVAKVRERVFAEVHGVRPATRPADEQVAPHNGFGPKQRFRGRVTPAAPASPGTLAAEEPSPPAEAGRSAPAGEATVSVELPRFKREEVPEPSETSASGGDARAFDHRAAPCARALPAARRAG